MLRKAIGSEVTLDKKSSIIEFGSMTNHDAAEATIIGRYPESGFSLNKESDMIVRVVEGNGRIATRDKAINVHEGSVIFIEKQTPYYYAGERLTLFMVSSPAWTPAQYENIS